MVEGSVREQGSSSEQTQIDTYNNVITLAHLVEHQIFNPRVAGSIPVCYYLVSKLIEMSDLSSFRLPTYRFVEIHVYHSKTLKSRVQWGISLMVKANCLSDHVPTMSLTRLS